MGKLKYYFDLPSNSWLNMIVWGAKYLAKILIDFAVKVCMLVVCWGWVLLANILQSAFSAARHHAKLLAL